MAYRNKILFIKHEIKNIRVKQTQRKSNKQCL